MPPESTRRPASRMFIPNHLALVQNVKVRLQSEGASLDGPCGAWLITNTVAWALRNEGAGLLDKPGGNNCRGYATDIVCYSDGTKVDILGDGGGANQPTWNVLDEPPQPERFRPALDPGEPIPNPGPTPGPSPEPPHGAQPYPGDEWCSNLLQLFNAQYAEAGQPRNDGRFIWVSRTLYDVGAGLEKEASKTKHLAELRQALGLG